MRPSGTLAGANVRAGSRPLLLLVGALLATAIILATGPSRAEAKACGDVKVKGMVLVVGGAGADCDFQRNWTKRFIRRGKEPRHWDCHMSSPRSGGCDDRNSKAFFIYYPPD